MPNARWLEIVLLPFQVRLRWAWVSMVFARLRVRSGMVAEAITCVQFLGALERRNSTGSMYSLENSLSASSRIRNWRCERSK